MKLKKYFSFILCGILASAAVLTGCQQTPEQSSSSEESKASTVVSQTSEEESKASQEQSTSSEKTPEESSGEKVIDLLVGETYNIQDELIRLGYKTEGFVYLSSNELVLDVKQDGTIKGNKVGNAELTVRDSSNEIVTKYAVHITEKTSRTNTITPTVWEVTDAEGNVIYMMGTIHAADKNVYNMPDYFEAAYKKCDSLAVECDTVLQKIDFIDTLSIVRKFTYTGTDNIKNHVSAKAYEKAESLLTETGDFSPLYTHYIPSMWLSLLESAVIQKSDLSYDYGVDNILLKRAFTEGKNILELESVEFQMNLLTELPEVVTILEFESYAEENAVEENIKELKSMYENWKAGTVTEENIGLANENMTIDDILTEEVTEEDIQILNRLLTSYTGSEEHNIKSTQLTEEDKKVVTDMVNESMKEYNNVMLFDRNIGMAQKAVEYMHSDNIVMMVAGSAHFQGDKGIIKLMEEKGCTVRKLTSADADDLKQTISVAGNNEESRQREETDPAIPKTV